MMMTTRMSVHNCGGLLGAGTGARCVTRRSLGRGCCAVISARTPVRGRSAALTAARRSPTGPTCARTSRPTPRPRTTSARAAGDSSRSSPTSTSTAARPAPAPELSSRVPDVWTLTGTCRSRVDRSTTTAAARRWPAADWMTISPSEAVCRMLSAHAPCHVTSLHRIKLTLYLESTLTFVYSLFNLRGAYKDQWVLHA